MGHIILYYPASSRSHRVSWLLTELGIDYAIKSYQRLPQHLLSPELSALQSIGGLPILEIDGEMFAESSGILQFLLECHGERRLMPPMGTSLHARFLQLLHCGDCTAMIPVGVSLLADGGEASFTHWSIGWSSLVDRVILMLLDQIDAVLAGGPFVLGDEFSAADIQVTACLQQARDLGLLNDRIGLTAFLTRMEQRPAYCSAIERERVARQSPSLV